MKRSSLKGLTAAVLPLILIFGACQQTTEKQDQTAYAQQSVIAPASEDPEEKQSDTEHASYLGNPPISKSVSVKNDEGLEKTAVTIRERFIDSLNKVVSVYNKTKYNKVSVSYFTSLAHSLGGKTFFADNADSLTGTIMEILSSRLDDGTDIVFLIDKTGSMDDDLENVKQSLSTIMKYLSNFNNVKLAIASYGDKNYQYDFWYNRGDLSSDVTQLQTFMDGYTTIGNPDVPESVNDAIVRTVREMNWTEGNKRLMLVIGDAPSQQPPLSSYTEKEVIAVCDSMHVKFNLYPIILSVTADGQLDVPFRTNFVKTYPNPVRDYLNADFDEEGQYFYELNDISGKKILQNSLSEKSSTIDMSSISNGTYLLQIYNQSTDKYYSSKVLVQH
ncbi:MAG: hypothetical protein JWO09_3113 [Bacteroidetes bacterium]|nr:hypothetical protein [Bacteroidota bacterium]